VGRHPTASQRGFSLPELLIVTTVLAILTAFLVPLAAERVRVTRIRTVVNQFALDMRAARWAAVSGGTTVDLAVSADPVNAYTYTDARGRVRAVALPEGVRIVSSTNPIRFRENGSIPDGAQTIIETEVTEDVVSRWTVTLSVLGATRTEHQRIDL
jgi:prepilin-type N-terminal cleavage/methylation domain-containing protein